MNKERKMKKLDSDAKSSTISKVVTFFVKILDDFHDFVSECVSLQRKINNPFWVVSVFRRKVTIFIGRETKTHIFADENQRKKIAKVSESNTNYFLRIILPCNNNNNTIWGGSVLTSEEPPLHSGKLKHSLPQAGGPTQSQLSRPMSSGHHISMGHRLRRKQLNSDTNASNKKIFEKKMKK